MLKCLAVREPSNIDVDLLVSITKNTYAMTKTIDDPAYMKNAKVCIIEFSFFFKIVIAEPSPSRHFCAILR